MAVPPAARGVAELQAVRLDTGAIVGARRVGRSGAFTLKLPAGPYVLLGTVLDRSAGTVITRASPPLSLRSGKRHSVSVSLAANTRVIKTKTKTKTTPKPKQKDRSKGGARSSYVQTSGQATTAVLAIEVEDFKGATGKLAAMNRGVAELLQTAMVAGGGGCQTTVIASARDRTAMASASRLKKSPQFDGPGTVKRDLVLADVAVRGRLTRRPGGLGYAITVSDSRTGRVIEVISGGVKLDSRYFTNIRAIVPSLMRSICNQPPAPSPTPPPPPPPPPGADTTAPAVTLTSPANGSASTTAATALAGVAGTAPGDSGSVTVRIFNSPIPAGLPLQTLTAERGADGAYGVSSATLGLGVYSARAEQTDAAGNTGLSSANSFSVVSTAAGATLIGAGDIAGAGASVGSGATAALLAQHPDAIVFTLGDNAYNSGQPSEYTNFYDPTWGAHKARTRPIVGGHDTATVSGGALPNQGFSEYFSAQLAPFGPTATDRMKAYYSYDAGAWHVIALNSSCYKEFAGCDVAAQEQWFRADLAAHPSACTAVMWHDPRWSSGNVHGNQLFTQALWDIAYTNGVDLVLSGSEHDYERFAPQDANGSFDPAHGIRSFVVGTGGYYRYTLGTRKPNSEAYDADTYGVIRLTLRPAGYDWQFLPVAGQTFTDSGTDSCHNAPLQPTGTPLVRSSTSNSAPHLSTSLTIDKPAGTQAGDVLLATIAFQSGSSRDIAPPSGWSVVPNTSISEGTNAGIRAFYRVATGSEPASYPFGLTGGSGQAIGGGIMAITGADTANPIDASGSLDNGAPSSYTMTSPSITTTRPRTLLVSSIAINQGTTFTPPQLMPEQWDVKTSGPYNVTSTAAAGGVADAGPTGTRTSTLFAPASGVAISIAIAGP